MSNTWNDTYPRPQLVRDEWMGLNGEWRFRTEKKGKTKSPDSASEDWETIQVPFCPESSLSGIGRRIAQGETMIYEREFSVPQGWEGRRVILHFDAVDQTCRVFIDGREAGAHEGGYLPFSIDITEFLKTEPEDAGQSDESNSEEGTAAADERGLELDWSDGADSNDSDVHVLRVEAIDNIDHRYPWGKQKRDNGGMWYTPVSGIWKSVWMEPVSDVHIESVTVNCGADWVDIRAYGPSEGILELEGKKYLMQNGTDGDRQYIEIHVDIPEPHMWSPEDPHLYNFVVRSRAGDRISSYFALRTLTIEEDADGYSRLCLNGKPYFFNGLLDQGYWQDGIYTPESPDKFAGDILAMKSLGFNTLRKHIKVEHEQFYYECDRLGMVVFQDMVNNGSYSFLRDSALPTVGMKNRSDRNANRGASRQIFLKSMDETVRHLYNHPSVCYWTIFNEGWGQFCADDAYDRLKSIDSTRFVDSTSGWFAQSRSDVDSHHVYFKKIELTAGERPLVLSEFGGYACRIPGHCYNPDKVYGYRKCADEAALLGDIVRLYEDEILPLREKGLCAAIYTQLSDIEDETNGILTYDREILKFRSYSVPGRIEVLGSYTDRQGGKVITVPASKFIKAYTAENHSNSIRIFPSGSEPFEVSIIDRTGYRKGTAAASVTGILEGFIDLFGQFRGAGNGFDVYIRSEMEPGSALGSSAAFEILMCRIINDRYFRGRADAEEMAKIAVFAEDEYLGRPRGTADRLAVSIGKPVMADFSRSEPEVEPIELSPEADGIWSEVTNTELTASVGEYLAVNDDMQAVADALGISRLGDINEEQFRRKRSVLENMVKRGELTELQIGRAQYFYDENERVLAASIALETGNTERFLQCIRESRACRERIL